MKNRILKAAVGGLALLTLLTFAACTRSEEDIRKAEDNSPEKFEYTGADNASADTVTTPYFNYDSGVYHDSFVLLIKCDSTDYTIRYTLDGKIPKNTSPEYKNALSVDMKKAKESSDGTYVYTFRAACFDKKGKMAGSVATATYVMAPKDRFTTQVITMTTDPDNLTGSKGIFLPGNYSQRGREWERPVDFKLFSKGGDLEIEQAMGMRINGTGSRSNQQKNLRLFARKEYSPDHGHLNYPIFKGLISETTAREINDYDTFLVRGGASNFRNTMITNLITYEMTAETNIGTAKFEPAALFINGQYYGVMMLIEDYGPYYFESHFGTPEDNISTINFTVCDAGLAWELDDGPEAEYEEWHLVRQFTYLNDLSDQKLYEQFCQMVDIENFCDYIISECYLNNWDWPRNNIRVWRYNGVQKKNNLNAGCGGYDPKAPYGLDGKWRFLAKDYDVSQGVTVSYNRGYSAQNDVDFFYVLEKDSYCGHRMDLMFWGLMKNENFYKLFLSRLAYFMSGPAKTENYLNTINKLELQIAEEMKYHTKQYKDKIEFWDFTLQWMRNFATVRPEIVIGNMRDRLGIEIVKVKIGEFKNCRFILNGVEVESGSYVYAVRGQNLNYEVIPDSGYAFDKFSVTNMNTFSAGYVRVKDTGDPKITPVLKSGKKTSGNIANHLVINEIGHSSLEKVNGYDWIELYNPTDKDIDLRSWTISNGISTFTFGSITVPAKGFKTLFCTDKEMKGVYVGFKIASEQTITISNPDSKVIDTLAILPQAKKGHVGRYPDGGPVTELTRYEITPNASNVHYTEFEHEYDEKVRNTAIFNGKLLPTSAFSKDSSGRLITSVKTLKSTGLVSDETLKLLKSKAKLGDSDTFVVAEILNKINDDTFHGYFVEELNSFVFTLYDASLEDEVPDPDQQK